MISQAHVAHLFCFTNSTLVDISDHVPRVIITHMMSKYVRFASFIVLTAKYLIYA